MRNIMLMYHPVKKDIHFFTNSSGEYAEIQYENCPRLQKYSFEKGEFLLQNQGNDFFDSIVETFLGIKHSKIVFKGTKIDYEDFVKMVKDYNEFKGEEILKLGDFIEIADIDSIYKDIINFYLETMDTFENELKYEDTRNTFIKRKNDLDTKIKKLEENNVNLCMVGTYSSGKSTFINAIIGRRILPENINSETAKMFRIKNSSIPSINFIIKKDKNESGHVASILWDKYLKMFRFTTDIKDDAIKAEIDNVISSNKDLLNHEQLHNIIKFLNTLPNDNNKKYEAFIDGIIDINYPIPLCKNINFTFFDTPGTDSNSDEHLMVLKDALQNQTNSILIIVYSPEKMEGTGNSILYKLLNESQEEEAKGKNVTIDLSRSLHIINQSDRYEEEELNDIRDKKIKASLNSKDEIDDNNFSELEYDLKKKRVFYVSSKGAYCAKAKLEGVANDKDEKFLRRSMYRILDDRYFLYNNLAEASTETEELKKNSLKLLDDYEEIDDEDIKELKGVLVSSGMHAIENEIEKYAKKYALAVKAKGLYDGVVYVINSVKNDYEAIESQARESKDEIRRKITLMRTNMVNDINNSYEEFEKYLNEENMRAQLPEIEAIHNKVSNVIIQASKEVKKMPKIAYDVSKFENKNKAIIESLNQYARDLDNYYKQMRVEIIKKQMDSLNDVITKKIKEYKGIDEAIIKQILNVSATEVSESVLKPFKMLEYINKGKALFIFSTTDKKNYIQNVSERFVFLTHNQFEEYIKEIKEVAKINGSKLRDELVNNIDMLSGRLEKLSNDERRLETEQNMAKVVLDKVEHKYEELNNKMWRAINE